MFPRWIFFEMSLYFIAIEPPNDLSKRIREIQRDFKERYGSRKSYDSFPHITLVPPFRSEESSENSLIEKFHKIALPEQPFEIILDGFGSFSNRKNPVIFVKPHPSAHLNMMRNALVHHFTEAEDFFHPHLTVAYKDLTPENFQRAWTEYNIKEFNGKWTVNSVKLYKHYDRLWNLVASRDIKKS